MMETAEVTHLRSVDMKPWLGLAFLLVTAALPVTGPHPFAKAKVGDWIEYHFDFALDGKPLAVRGEPVLGQVRMHVKAREKDTLKVEYISLNVPPHIGVPPSIFTVRLDKPFALPAYEEEKEGRKREGIQVTYQSITSGKETLTLQGKKYSCTWVRRIGTYQRENTQDKVESTLWYCDAVPLDGMVKSVVITSTSKVVQTMTNYGRASDKQ